MNKKMLLEWSSFVSFMAGLIWTACRVIPLVWYRFDHTKLTDTELMLYSMSMASWWDLCPAALLVYGFVMLPKK